MVFSIEAVFFGSLTEVTEADEGGEMSESRLWGKDIKSEGALADQSLSLSLPLVLYFSEEDPHSPHPAERKGTSRTEQRTATCWND